MFSVKASNKKKDESNRKLVKNLWRFQLKHKVHLSVYIALNMHELGKVFLKSIQLHKHKLKNTWRWKKEVPWENEMRKSSDPVDVLLRKIHRLRMLASIQVVISSEESQPHRTTQTATGEELRSRKNTELQGSIQIIDPNRGSRRWHHSTFVRSLQAGKPKKHDDRCVLLWMNGTVLCQIQSFSKQQWVHHG